MNLNNNSHMCCTRVLDKYLLALCIMAAPLASLAQTEGAAEPSLKQVLEAPAAEQTPPAQAAPSAPTKAIPVKVGPDDKYERGTPRSTAEGYIRASRAGDHERAAEYLDLRNLPKGYTTKDGPELARQLKIVLDRKLWIDMDILSSDPKGHSDDGLPSYRDLVGQIEAKGRKIDILLQRVPRGDGVYIWKVSSKTVRNIPTLYSEHGYGAIGEKLSQSFPTYRFLALELWQWVFLILIMLSVTVVLFPIVRLTTWLIRRKGHALAEVQARFVRGPLYLAFVFVISRQFFDEFHPSLEARALFKAGTITTIIVAWMIMRLADLLRDHWAKHLQQQGREHAIVLLRPAVTTFNLIVILIAVLVWLDNIGFSVTTVIAGLGIGGIAVALATQKSIENFIGAVTLYMAAPVRVGDFCRVGDKVGIIEEIGLRATKLRTLEKTAITIPNSDLANLPIENFAGREQFRFNPRISLRIGTTPDQLRFILLEFQKLLHAHSKVAESPLRARFVGFGEHSLDIDIHCYIETTDFAEFLAISEDLNLRIMDIIQQAGTEIAIPANIEYKDEASKPDKFAKEKAEMQVAEMREQGNLIPELSQDQIQVVKNTIPYPPDKDI